MQWCVSTATTTRGWRCSPAPAFRERYTNGYGLGGITRGLEIFKPIITAVNGYAMSRGFEVAMACDLRLRSPDAVFALQDVPAGAFAPATAAWCT